MSEFSNVIGPILLGVFLNAYLYGVLALQYASYQLIKFGDPYWIKYPVLFLFVLDTFHTASTIYMAWGYCVSNYINPSALLGATWPYTLTPICTALSGIITHTFLARRTFHLLKQRVLHGVTLALVVLCFVLGVACGVFGFLVENALVGVPSTYEWLYTVSLAFQVVLNVLISGTLAYALHRYEAGFRTGEHLLHRIIRVGIQTGTLGGVFALAGLIAFRASPRTTAYALFTLPIGRIYTNAVLGTLLDREPPAPPTAAQHGQIHSLCEPAKARPVFMPALKYSHPSQKQADAIWTPQSRSKPPTQASFSVHSIHVHTEVFTDAVNSGVDEDPKENAESAAGSSYVKDTKVPLTV